MKITKKYLPLLIIMMLAFGCSEEFLDRQPLDQQVTSTFYKTEEDAMQALVSIYDAMQYQSSPGVSWAPFVAMTEILSDDAYAGGGDANDGQDEDEFNLFNIPTTNVIVHSLWLKNYVGIYRANLYLEVIDGVDTSDEFKARTSAEAKFMRAYFHFELARFFENIPMMTSTIGGPSEYSQTQNTPAETYNQIAKDLVESMADLPEFLPADGKGRISKWAAQAMLARVYLFYNGVYGSDLVAGDLTVDRAKALEYLEDMIARSGHDLLPDFSKIFKPESEYSIENVFEIGHGDTPPWFDWGYVRGGEGNLTAQMMGPRVTGSDNFDRGWSFGPVTQSLFVEMENDPRLSGTILQESDLDGTLNIGYQHSGYFSNKYSSDSLHWGSAGQFEHNRTNNFRVIRHSDVLLMAAELGSPSAQSYLDAVRARVGLPSVPVSLDNIYNERRVELALEGIRYFDVLRRGLGYANNALSMTGERGPNFVGDQQLFDVTFNMATKGFLPIPQVEIDLSNNVFIQNAGY